MYPVIQLLLVYIISVFYRLHACRFEQFFCKRLLLNVPLSFYHNIIFLQAMLLQLCPDLTDAQLARLVCMFQDSSSGGFIAYNAFLSRFTSQPPVYRRGNNLGQLLAHRPSIYTDTLINPQPPEMINASPTYGLPGVKVILQKQVQCTIPH